MPASKNLHTTGSKPCYVLKVPNHDKAMATD
jgi:hypothetical protein